jgi:hypothetical protein
MQPRLSEKRWAQAFKFAIVRNPWDRAVSLYEYRVQTNQTGLGSTSVPFEEWLRLVFVERDPYYHDQPKMLQSQSDWLKDASGNMPVDFVGRFENLNAEFAVVAQKLGITAQLPHLNRSKRKTAKPYYTDDSVEIIARYFAEDIERFGYKYQPKTNAA